MNRKAVLRHRFQTIHKYLWVYRDITNIRMYALLEKIQSRYTRQGMILNGRYSRDSVFFFFFQRYTTTERTRQISFFRGFLNINNWIRSTARPDVTQLSFTALQMSRQRGRAPVCSKSTRNYRTALRAVMLIINVR